MKIFIFLISFFFSSFSFAKDSKFLFNDEACIYGTIIKNWNNLDKELPLIINFKDFEKSFPPITVSSDKLDVVFNCKISSLIKDSFLVIDKDDNTSWSNIKGYWFVYKKNILKSNIQNFHLYQKHTSVDDFDVFRFDLDYPL